MTHYKHDTLTQVLSRLTRAEQLQVIITHPFFTGQCPQCQHKFAGIDLDLIDWHCVWCGWVDTLGDSLELTQLTQNDSFAHQAEVKRLGSYLIEAGLLSEAQVDIALAEQKVTGMRLGEVVVKHGWINNQTVEYLMQKVVLPERTR